MSLTTHRCSNLPTTPVERYEIDGRPVWVKREDTCAPDSAPPFSKMRGLMRALSDLQAQGITHIGYCETSISMAGWGIAWGCLQLGMKAVIFDPQYVESEREDLKVLEKHRERWKSLCAEIIPIPAGMAAVNFHICSQEFRKRYPSNSRMLPLGIPLRETVIETAIEASRTYEGVHGLVRSCVVCVGSGTIAAGVTAGICGRDPDFPIYGVLCRTGDVSRKRRSIAEKGGFSVNGLWGYNLTLIDRGWDYTQACEIETPFPTHRYYDAKAWHWLVENLRGPEPIPEPVLFWNIGREA